IAQVAPFVSRVMRNGHFPRLALETGYSITTGPGANVTPWSGTMTPMYDSSFGAAEVAPIPAPRKREGRLGLGPRTRLRAAGSGPGDVGAGRGCEGSRAGKAETGKSPSRTEARGRRQESGMRFAFMVRSPFSPYPRQGERSRATAQGARTARARCGDPQLG